MSCVHPIHSQLKARPTPALPVAGMIIGQPAEQAAALLPRLFNLCRQAQGLGARAAFGLPLPAAHDRLLAQEIFKEHVLKLCVKWPAQFGLAPAALPRNWTDMPPAMANALFGPTGAMPDDPLALKKFLAAPGAAGQILSKIGQSFAPFEAVNVTVPLSSGQMVFQDVIQDNSVAARHADHPVMQHIERDQGRGPLWYALAVCYDLEACLHRRLPALSLATGRAIIPAARGLYGIKATVSGGTVTAFERVTPTDHLLRSGGVLDQMLASLPAQKSAALAPLLLSILDPCFPVKLDPVKAQEPQHA